MNSFWNVTVCSYDQLMVCFHKTGKTVAPMQNELLNSRDLSNFIKVLFTGIGYRFGEHTLEIKWIVYSDGVR
jgi:hypothetical protein